MAATIIDGKKVSADIKAELKMEVAQLKSRGIEPCLAVALVGDDPGSHIYVRNKEEACALIGIRSIKEQLPASTSQEDVLALVESWNQDKAIDGILVQSPLPKQIDEHRVLLAIDSAKDVDGWHPFNVGQLMIGESIFESCTPSGIIELLKRYDIEIAGSQAVVVGRSNIVGKPVAMLLLHNNATVEICHSKTRDLAAETRRADILIAAVGKPKFITADMIKPGAAVIDVGMNRTEAGLCGDVDFAGAKEVAGAITPVPGGVGPMTIAMLMRNTVQAAKAAAGI
ncbi:MAG: bifunctional methylenetetrahydrofolate dehydrogenase/methenyltetrahydrofolate cyclohydrolase FolD [Actinomycetota bacterium]|nr:bifunctional methylenetetrahydrofolate dehydrogenase/methenyltetrahydrofolate cyclohydrolase FolD [Actinomycetota bacterium]